MPKRDIEEWFWHVGTDLPRSVDDLVGRPQVASAKFWEPRVDLIEEDDRLLLKAEIAGVAGDDIQLLYIPDRHAIIIKGFRPESDLSDGNRTGIHQLEIYYGDFQREVSLPDISIDASRIRAQYRNGILIVLIPKLDQIVVTKTVTFHTL